MKSILISLVLSLVFSKDYYFYENLSETINYSPIKLNQSLYNSSAVCVTVFDLIAFHYTQKPLSFCAKKVI